MEAQRIQEILYTSHFKRAIKTLSKTHLQTITEREVIFRANCFDQRLKTHKLQGKLKDCWSFSITYSHRIMFKFLKKDCVVFIDIGDHSIYL
ncbi:MAG: type II toxin-antitoxin system mRNA interferase toxin, RelE/StbE family [Patescibacteria group bacterium]